MLKKYKQCYITGITVHAHIVGSRVISDKKGKELLNKKKVSEQNCTVKHDIPTFNPQSKKKLN